MAKADCRPTFSGASLEVSAGDANLRGQHNFLCDQTTEPPPILAWPSRPCAPPIGLPWPQSAPKPVCCKLLQEDAPPAPLPRRLPLRQPTGTFAPTSATRRHHRTNNSQTTSSSTPSPTSQSSSCLPSRTCLQSSHRFPFTTFFP